MFERKIKVLSEDKDRNVTVRVVRISLEKIIDSDEVMGYIEISEYMRMNVVMKNSVLGFP